MAGVAVLVIIEQVADRFRTDVTQQFTLRSNARFTEAVTQRGFQNQPLAAATAAAIREHGLVLFETAFAFLGIVDVEIVDVVVVETHRVRRCHTPSRCATETTSRWLPVRRPPGRLVGEARITARLLEHKPLFAGNLEERVAEFRSWCETVRDPANAHSEGVRRLESANGRAVAEYEIAPLPDGRFAVRVRCEYRSGTMSGMSSPWTAMESREDCVAYFLQRAQRHFRQEQTGRKLADSQHVARQQMRKLLTGGLFGFIEPECCENN